MRWCSIFECVHQEAKLSLCTLWCEAENLKHLLLKSSVVDTEGTSTHFNTITYEVVSLGTYLLRMLIQERNIIRIWHSERMVSSHQALLFIAPLKQWEVNNPETLEHVLVAQAQAVAHFQTERAELNTSLVCVVAAEDKNQVTVFSAHHFLDLSQYFWRVELVDAALHSTVSIVLDEDETLGANLWSLNEVCEFIELLATIVCTTRNTNTTDIFSLVKDREFTLASKSILQFHEFHSETQVWFITTKSTHSLVPSHLFQLWQFHATDFLEQVASHFLKQIDDVVLINKTHLAVNLSELWLTVSTQVFITEALCNLEVAVETSHHQELLQSLRTLWQSVELTRVHT